MKIERARLRIFVSAIVGGVVGVASYWCGSVFIQPFFVWPLWGMWLFILTTFSVGTAATAVLMHLLTPREPRDGHTRCGKCGYILKGLTEPRCSECGERI